MPNLLPENSSKKTKGSRNPLPKPRHQFIKSVQSLGYKKIIGIDEVGCGALAGPVVVAAVEIYLPIIGINDSKLLSAKQRFLLNNLITHNSQQLSIGQASNAEIDHLGLSVALELAYQRCLEKITFDLVLTDNFRLPNLPYIKIVKGDQLFYPVSAASIVAKVFRDQLMCVYDSFHPHYCWHQNAGYGTPAHKKALDTIGPSLLHRQSFL
ncbi:MAG: ribonuclease HII [Candidatus Berkelbacteria bacterium]|nr:ribonuclease HII [Candidatus Berkelbacteria bacterium]